MYEQLEAIQKRLNAISHAVGILHWDNSVMMPSGGANERADALATLGEMSHEILTSDELGECLDTLPSVDLDDWQRANVHELTYQRTHARAVPSDLLVALEHAIVACDQVWRENRRKNDWAGTVSELKEVFNLTRQKAQCLGEALDLSCYDALLDIYEPGLRRSFIDPIFTELRSFLPNLIDDVLSSQPVCEPITGAFSDHAQMQLARDLSSRLGFDYARGRIDTSHHPFSCGSVDDARLTTRHQENSFLQSAFATFHETGHALYTQGLPADRHADPAGRACGMMLHESQSLFMEMQICRSDAFLEFLHPIVCDHFDVSDRTGAWSKSNFRNVVRNVQKSYIRVDADELTYPLHVMLRYRLEREVLDEVLQVEDLPAAWDEQMQELLGLSTAGNYENGVMQDTHWFTGSIGYFPTYTLGAVTAAQMFAAMKADIGDPANDIRQGKVDHVLHWLRTNVHSKGRLLSSMELIKAATGAPLTLEAFTAHLQERYLQTDS